MNSRGLGDTIDKFTTITGIKWLWHRFFPDCGCDKRRHLLNHWFPYFKRMTLEQQKVWEDALPEIQARRITGATAAKLHQLHFELFGKTVNGKCSSCGRKMLEDLGRRYHDSAVIIIEHDEEETEADNSGEEVS